MTYRTFTDDQLRNLAKSFPSAIAFRKADPSACQTAGNRGILDEVFPDRTRGRRFSESQLIAYGKTFKTRNEFRKNDMSAYTKARIAGLLNIMFPESAHKGRENNAVYLLQVVGRANVFKVGATSTKNAHRRRWQQDSFAKMRHATVIPATKVVGKATDLESFFLTLGVSAGFQGFDGATEYRVLDDEDIQVIRDMVELCRAD